MSGGCLERGKGHFVASNYADFGVPPTDLVGRMVAADAGWCLVTPAVDLSSGQDFFDATAGYTSGRSMHPSAAYLVFLL